MWALRFLLVFLTVFTVIATTTGGPVGAEDQRAFLTLTINTQSRGEVVAIIREDDILLAVRDLEADQLHSLTGTRETIDGTSYVSLRSLAPAVTYVYDEAALTLALTAGANLFGAHAFDLGPTHPAGLVYGTDASAFLNYSLTEENNSPSLFLESSITNGIARLYLSGYSNPETHLGEGLDRLVWDNRVKLRTTTVGDEEIAGADLGSNVIVRGFDVRRNFGLDPYVVTYPTAGITGLVTTPSTADIYINGILIRRIDLPPGAYNLNNLPIPSGIANTQVVLRDALGRQTTVQQNFYQGANLLAKGDTDYDYTVGFPRIYAQSILDTTQSAAVLGRYRIGLSDAFTVGARFEGTSSLTSGGPSFDVRLPLGELHTAAAVSSQNGLGGTATSLGYTYSGRAIGFGIFQTSYSANYARVDLPISSDRTLVDLTANANASVTHNISLSGSYGRQNYRDSGVGSNFSVGLTYALSRRLNLNINASRSFGQSVNGRVDSIYATLTFTGDKRTSVSATYQNTAGVTTPLLTVQHALPTGDGIGYNLNLIGGPDPSLTGQVVTNLPFGQYTFDYGTASGSTAASVVTLAGSLVTMGHGVFFGRPVLDGFALVETTGSDRLDVQLENLFVAVARGSAHVVLPNLTPNFANIIAVSDPNAAINSTIERDEFLVAPAVQSGVRVRIKAAKFQAFEGSIAVMLDGQTIVPAYGQVTITNGGKSYRSDLGENGEFYFEDLPAGTYDGHAEYKEGACTLSTRIPESPGITVDLGSIACVAR